MGILGGIFGKKKFPPREQINAGDVWLMGAAVLDSGPTILRLRKSAKSLIGHPELPVLFTVGVVLKNPDENGFHGEDEGKEIGIIEDCMSEAIEKDKLGVFVGSVLSQGVKEFMFYVASKDTALERVQAMPELAKDRDIHLGATDEPDWKTLKGLLE